VIQPQWRGAEDALTSSTRQLLAVAENYPQLKASELFLNLQEQLTNTEDKVEFSRRFYNGNVRDFNTALQTFPTSIFGQMLHFQPFAFFAAAESERAAPTVSFVPQAPTAVAPPPLPRRHPPDPTEALMGMTSLPEVLFVCVHTPVDHRWPPRS